MLKIENPLAYARYFIERKEGRGVNIENYRSMLYKETS
jgi:hypothetical protein